MSILTYPLGFLGGGGEAFYNGVMENSLLLTGGLSFYRTPASEGNRRTWTWSGWVKISEGGTTNDHYIFAAGANLSNDSNNSITNFLFNSDDKFQVYVYNSGTTLTNLISTAVHRDTAWYHVVVAMNTPATTAGDRTKVWINGREITSWGTSTYPAQNLDTYINDNTPHALFHYLGAFSLGNLLDWGPTRTGVPDLDSLRMNYEMYYEMYRIQRH